MPQFFVKSSDIKDNKCIIAGDDSNHLRRVKRAKPGDIIYLRSEEGCSYKAVISEVRSGTVTAVIQEKIETEDMPFDLSLYIAVLKGKTFDFVLQKATEIGVSRIIPVITERTVPIIDRKADKRNRWAKIVESASKQSMRRDIPVVEDISFFEEAAANAGDGIKIIAHTDKSGQNIREYLAGKDIKRDISILIGPEGGFTDKEIELARTNNWGQVVFGFTTLRSETASIVIPSVLIYELSNYSF